MCCIAFHGKRILKKLFPYNRSKHLYPCGSEGCHHELKKELLDVFVGD
jgi:hypothetical protein